MHLFFQKSAAKIQLFLFVLFYSVYTRYILSAHPYSWDITSSIELEKILNDGLKTIIFYI